MAKSKLKIQIPLTIKQFDLLIGTVLTYNDTVNKQLLRRISDLVDNINKKLDCDFFFKDTIISKDVNDWIDDKTNGLIQQIINRLYGETNIVEI